jgi:hypothetical protein
MRYSLPLIALFLAAAARASAITITAAERGRDLRRPLWLGDRDDDHPMDGRDRYRHY